jgi:cytochrome b6-f complex iron-sulfur subunit
MSLVDDLKVPLTPDEAARRRFLQWLGGSALGLTTLGSAGMTLRFLQPNVVYEEDRRFVVGRPDDIAVGTVLVLAKQNVYVVRTPQGFFALSAVCAHLGCLTRFDKQANGFVCPCHGSQYSQDGQVIGGPAPRGLTRVEVSVERGLLVVDAGKPVADDALLVVKA